MKLSGGLNHLLAILDLVDLALQDPDINYIHIISEADIPVRKIEDFDFFEDNNNIYMDCTNIQQISNYKIKERYERGILFQDISQKDYFKKIINILYKFCHKKRLGIGEFEEQNIYKGLVYISAPSYVYKDVLNYVKEGDFLIALKNVFIPEEFFFQTIIMNSKYEKNVINHNLRYDDWSQFRNGHLPAILDITDYPLICQDEYFFARKIDYNISKDLLQKIGRDINFYFFD